MVRADTVTRGVYGQFLIDPGLVRQEGGQATYNEEHFCSVEYSLTLWTRDLHPPHSSTHPTQADGCTRKLSMFTNTFLVDWHVAIDTPEGGGA